MEYGADQVLQSYFKDNEARIADWFNVITPKASLKMLHEELSVLRNKDWRDIHHL
jgi:hypothetical protein